MAFPIALIGPLVNLFKKGIDKIAPDKVSQEQKLKLVQDFQLAVQDNKDEFEADLRQFFLEYEGRAADLPRSIQIIRGALRTVVTYCTFAAFLAVICSWVFGWFELAEGADQGIRYLFYLTMVVISWWFGDRFIQRSGFADLMRRGKDG